MTIQKYYKMISQAKKRMKHLQCNNCKGFKRLFNKDLKECNCDNFHCEYYPFEYYEYCRKNGKSP